MTPLGLRHTKLDTIPFEVCIPQVPSGCSQGIFVNVGKVAAGFSPRAYVGCGIQVGLCNPTSMFSRPIRFTISSDIAQVRFWGGGWVPWQKAFLLVHQPIFCGVIARSKMTSLDMDQPQIMGASIENPIGPVRLRNSLHNHTSVWKTTTCTRLDQSQNSPVIESWAPWRLVKNATARVI